jgi:hypothetical protein
MIKTFADLQWIHFSVGWFRKSCESHTDLDDAMIREGRQGESPECLAGDPTE